MMKRVFWLLMGAMLLLPNVAVAAQATPGASPAAAGGFSAETTALFDAFLDQFSATCPGAVLYVDAPGTRFHEARGVAGRDTQEPLDPDAPFEIGSNTKMMTATIVLQLQEEGKLSVDDPIADWLPDVATALDPLGAGITIRQLMNHTSGLYDYVDDLASAIFIGWERTGDTTPLTQAWTPQEIVEYVAKYRAGNAYFPAGQEGAWHYSNTNYILLGLIIEQATGGTYADALQSRIFDPLDMTDTMLLDGSPTPDQVGSGYYLDMDTTDWNLSQAWAAGAVVSTPQDMAIFMRALIGGELFQQPETLALMQDGVTTPLGEYGLGLIQTTPGVWGHGGQTLGYDSAIAYDPARDLVLVGWTNCATSGISQLEYLFAAIN